jgi:conjugal transfer/entry exclusion protein
MKYVKVQERADLVRDQKSNAILSVDDEGLVAYKRAKKKMNTIDTLQEESKVLKDKVQSIEDKLDKLLLLLQSNK